MTTLNHPAMISGVLELGSVVIDIDGNTFTAQMLNSSVQVTRHLPHREGHHLRDGARERLRGRDRRAR